jgi:Tol biopolymer transport system component
VALSERLYSVRTDGSGYTQLLDDDWRNRLPRWSPDGGRIAFYSNREGAYEIWSVNADGSGLARLASDPKGSLYYPCFSPDGSRLVGNNYDGTRVYTLGGTAFGGGAPPPAPPGGRGVGSSVAAAGDDAGVVVLPKLAEERNFFAVDWSPDGSRLLGFGVKPDGVAEGIHVFTFATGTYEKVSEASTHFTLWLPDGKRLLYASARGALCLLDASTRESRDLLPPGTLAGDSSTFGLSGDGRTLVYLSTTREADVWLLAGSSRAGP